MTRPDPTMEAIREVYQFMWDARTAVLHGLGRVPWAEASAPTERSKRSLVDAYIDLLETEAYWAHHVLDNRAASWEDYDRSNVTNSDLLGIHSAGVERATAERLAALPAEELSKPRPAPDKGEWTARDVLLKAATENLIGAGVLAGRLEAAGVAVRLPQWAPNP